MLTLTNRIDMRPGAVPLVIHLGQYDSDFTLVFELYSSAGDFAVESDTTAMIRGTKTDGHAYDADATINISAKTVTVAGSEQMTAAKGRNVYELVLKKGTKVLSTANFILDVERAAMDADTIASESVLKELNAIIDSAATSTQAAADAVSAADRAEDAADSVSSASTQIATNTADIADLKADFEQLEPGLSAEAKAALLACFEHVAWIDAHGQDYYDALYDALYDEEPEPEPEWGSDYTWLYNPTEDGLLSTRTDIVTQSTSWTNMAEEIVDNVLNLSSAYNNATGVYNLINTTNTSAKLKAKFRINHLENCSQPGDYYGFRLQLSNGTAGVVFYTNKYNDVYNLITFSEQDAVQIATLSEATWYIAEVVIQPGKAIIYLNGSKVYESTSLSTLWATANRISAQAYSGTPSSNTVDIDVAWITYKNNDN